MNDNKSRYSLSDLQYLIKQSLEEKLPGFYWVSTEISEMRINYSGHCYLELVEKDKSENIRSKSRGVIWASKARLLLPYFENTTGQALSEGIKVLLRVKIEFHELYGLSLVVYDIDPAYTMGEMAIKRKQILEKLESEGVIDINKQLPFPILPKRIAVVSSKEAAGYSDFTDELERNEYAYIYHTRLFKAVMQGTETERSVIKAINKIFEDDDEYDLIVIVRGGGSQSDLSWFDNYNIAYLITQIPLPVLTGIGHEKDLSVTDIVAHRSFKTPTAVAGFIINQSLKTEEKLFRLREGIISSARELAKTKRLMINRISVNMSPLVRSALQEKRIQINRYGLRLSGSTRSYLSMYNARLGNLKSDIGKRSTSLLSDRRQLLDMHSKALVPLLNKFTQQKQAIIDNFVRSIDYLSPSRVLERGYSITLYDNKTVRSSNEIKPGSEIDTLLHKGRIKSKVFDPKKPDNDKG